MKTQRIVFIAITAALVFSICLPLSAGSRKPKKDPNFGCALADSLMLEKAFKDAVSEVMKEAGIESYEISTAGAITYAITVKDSKDEKQAHRMLGIFENLSALYEEIRGKMKDRVCATRDSLIFNEEQGMERHAQNIRRIDDLCSSYLSSMGESCFPQIIEEINDGPQVDIGEVNKGPYIFRYESGNTPSDETEFSNNLASLAEAILTLNDAGITPNLVLQAYADIGSVEANDRVSAKRRDQIKDELNRADLLPRLKYNLSEPKGIYKRTGTTRTLEGSLGRTPGSFSGFGEERKEATSTFVPQSDISLRKVEATLSW